MRKIHVRRARCWLVGLACCFLADPAVSHAGELGRGSNEPNWPQFRGPGGEGHTQARGLPLEWSETKNIVWKTPIAGLGWSSPVIQDGLIWLTTATDEGRSLRVVSVDCDGGQVVHDVEVFHLDDPGNIHAKNSHASPSAIVEGDRVYVHYGRHGTACLTTSGEIVWRTQDLVYDHRHGPGGSPQLIGDRLIISCDGTDTQYVVALDKRTGAVLWKVVRGGQMAYSTPLAVEVDGATQVITTGGDAAMAYDPADGREIWRVRYPGGYSNVPRPVVCQGLVYLCTGYNTPTVMAVRLGGSGDVTDSHVAWILKKGAPLNPSPVAIGDLLYMVSDKGIATCVDAVSGEEIWQERLGGNFSASPLAADGRIYFTSEEGVTTVVAPGPEFKVLATNAIEDERRVLASLGVSGNALYLRSDTYLYRVEEPTSR